MTKALNLISLENLGTINRNKVTIESLTLWFSYKTIVAFQDTFMELVCCENKWSKTTGRFLNDICPNHKDRLEKNIFNKKLLEALKRYNLYIEN